MPFTLTAELLKEWFALFNNCYFGSELPMPRLALSKARTRLGTMSFSWRRTLLGVKKTGFTIRISTYYECSEREFQTVLLHEMIHYYIVFKNLRDTSAHGKTFRSIMQRLNSEHGWNISVSASVRGKKASQAAQQSKSLVVLALTMTDGTHMMTVVNLRSAPAIDLQASMTPQIASHRWYSTTLPQFSTFPKVRTLRARKVTNEFYESTTEAMTPLVLKRR